MGIYSSIKKSIPTGGGNPKTKAFVISAALCGLLAVPLFDPNKKQRQGHDYFSQEKPEAITAGQERQQRLKRKQREEEEAAAANKAKALADEKGN